MMLSYFVLFMILGKIPGSESNSMSSEHLHRDSADFHQGIQSLEEFLGVLNPGSNHDHPEEDLSHNEGITKHVNQSEERELTPAQDRQLLLPAPAGDVGPAIFVFDLPFLEQKYTELVQSLPLIIDDARDVITETIATKKMLGNTIIAGFMVGAILDTVAVVMLKPHSLAHAVTLIVTEKYYQAALHFLWWYAFGFSGPWMFPATFGAGSPEIQASSRDYFQLLRDHDLTLNIQSFTEKSPIVATLLIENLKRDFSERFGEIIRQREYVEAETVVETFNQMISLVSHHSQLTGPLAADPVEADLALLDQSLESLWDEMRLIEGEVTVDIRARRAETAAINVFIALLNMGGMIANVIMNSGVVKILSEDANLDLDKMREKDISDKISDVVSWLTEEDPPTSIYIWELGVAALIVAPLCWGYSYTFAYLLFLESVEPGCGPGDQIYARNSDLRTVGALLDSGVSRQTLSWRLDGWWQELQLDLHCLLNTVEGTRLANTIDMFQVLANHRLQY